jgi:hypothetical protein
MDRPIEIGSQYVPYEAADKYFIGNAQLLRRLIMVETALAQNTKIVVPANAELINVVGGMAGVLPLPRTAATTRAQRSLPLGGDGKLALGRDRKSAA